MGACLVVLDAESVQRCRAAGIRLMKYAATDQDGDAIDDGYLLDADEDLARVLDVVDGEEQGRRATQLEGIECVAIIRRPAGDRNSPLYRAAMKQLEGVVPTPVRFSLVGGKNKPLGPTSGFNIFVWSAVSGERRYKAPDKMYGKSLASDDKVYRSTGNGLNIPSPEGAVGAELIGNNLYILVNLERGTLNDCHLMTEICKFVAERLRNRGVQTVAEAQEEQSRIRAREAYVQACAKRLGDELAKLGEQKAKLDEEIPTIRQRLTGLIREARAIEEKLELLRTNRNAASERLGSEFDRLWSHPQVVDVRIEDSVLIIMTKVLNCLDPRSNVVHEIGAFRIEISNRAGVRWFNQTRVVNNGSAEMNAPHVRKDGSACLGNTEESFRELIAAHEFAAAAFLAIEFVQSVNVSGDRWGESIVRWPRAEDQTPPPTTKSAVT